MNRLVIILLVIAASGLWGNSAAGANATVSVQIWTPVTLVEGSSVTNWRRMPDFIRGSKIYSQAPSHNGNPAYGVVDFQVLTSGTLYIAAHFGYEGNTSGGWVSESLTLYQLLGLGWFYLGDMTWGDGTVFRIMQREVVAGEMYHLRVNKYTPPYVITPTAITGKIVSQERPWPVYGSVAVSDFTPTKLLPSTLNQDPFFSTVPDSLLGMTIFSVERRPHDGVLMFKLLQPMRVFVAGFWGYDGNDEGDWDDERITYSGMLGLGWSPVADLTYHDGRVFNVVSKLLPAGQEFRIRANKYTAPFLILPDPQQIVQLPVLKVTQSGPNVELNWPTNYSDFTLEATASLAFPAWSRVATSGTVVGANFSELRVLGKGTQFYRLRGP